MLNQSVIVGRLVKDPELYETENGNKVTNITLAVPRSYRNTNGEYDTDFIDCTLWTGIAENTAEYCKTGDIIGVKGRLQTRLIDNEDGTKYKKMEIIADSVTFLSSYKGGNNGEINNDSDSDDDYSSDDEIQVDVVKESEKKYNRKKIDLLRMHYQKYEV